MEDKKEAIITKIMKLMELGNEEKNSNAHEREAAMKMAAKLMADYAIDFVDLKNNKPKEDSFVTLDVEGSSEVKVDYEAQLASAIAYAFDCRVINSWDFRNFERVWKLVFLGSKHDIEIVVYFFKFLRRTLGVMATKNVTKESIKASDPYKARRITPQYIEQARNNYCFGMVHTINERLKELYAKREEFVPSDCKALMVVKKDDLEKFMKEKFPDLRHSRPVLKGDMNAFHKGRSDGHKVSLNRPLSDDYKIREQIG